MQRLYVAYQIMRNLKLLELVTDSRVPLSLSASKKCDWDKPILISGNFELSLDLSLIQFMFRSKVVKDHLNMVMIHFQIYFSPYLKIANRCSVSSLSGSAIVYLLM